MNHIDALNECILSPHISEECKTHLTQLKERLESQKTNRQPQNKLNKHIEDILNAEIKNDTDYTENEVTDIIINKGFTTTPSTTRGLMRAIGMRKQSTYIVDERGKKISIFKKTI